MIKIVSSLLFVSFCSASLFAATSQLEILENARKKAIATEKNNFDSAVSRINSNYVKKLEQLKLLLTRKGDLDGALKVRKIISRIEAGGGKVSSLSLKKSVTDDKGDYTSVKLGYVKFKSPKYSLRSLKEHSYLMSGVDKKILNLPKEFIGKDIITFRDKSSTFSGSVAKSGSIFIFTLGRLNSIVVNDEHLKLKKLNWKLETDDHVPLAVYKCFLKEGDSFYIKLGKKRITAIVVSKKNETIKIDSRLLQ